MVVLEYDELTIDNKNYKILDNNRELLYETLKTSGPIDDYLHVVSVISNVCKFKRRYQLMKQYIERMGQYKHIKLYIVELVYGDEEFHITDVNDPSHLQLRTKDALWHKENLINLGVKNLLPPDWKAFAWVDADVEFENMYWDLDTLKVLTKFDLVQLFTTCLDLNEKEIPMSIFQGFGYKYCNGEKYSRMKGINYWHPGYAWACTREFYDKVGGLYDKGILGSGDYIFTQCFIHNIACGSEKLHHFREDIKFYFDKIKLSEAKIGFTPGTIRHFYHGSKKERRYIERNEILVKINYQPEYHVKYDENGVLVPTENMPEGFYHDILQYFRERNDDEYYSLIEDITIGQDE